MKRLLKNQKGITILSLMIVLVVMAILAAIAVKNVDTGIDIKNYNKMCADIELLSNKIQSYYREHNSIPITGSSISDVSSQIDYQGTDRDNSVYYLIDLGSLYNVTLNYGGGNLSNKDVYIINEQSHEIYYLKGVKLENQIYHRKK